MALIKAMIHWEKGRPETGTKANMIPIKTDRAMTGHLMKKGRGRRYKTAATAMPPANWKNCLRVMSPTR